MAKAQRAESGERGRNERSLVSTLPGDSVRSAALYAEQPAWCVDLGHTLVAMTLYEVWLAFAQDQLTPETKVWREGMPWWEPLSQVPEFSLAMPEDKVPRSGPRSFGRSPAALSLADEGAPIAAVEEEEVPFELVSASALPAPPRMPAIEAPAPAAAAMSASELVTPAPVVVEHEEPAPRATSRRRILSRIDRRSVLSAAVGAAVAIFALAVATSGPASGGSTEAPPRAAAMGAPAGLWEQAPVVSSSAPALVRVGAAPATSREEVRAPEGSRAAAGERAVEEERGQKRARPWERGQKRAR